MNLVGLSPVSRARTFLQDLNDVLSRRMKVFDAATISESISGRNVEIFKFKALPVVRRRRRRCPPLLLLRLGRRDRLHLELLSFGPRSVVLNVNRLLLLLL